MTTPLLSPAGVSERWGAEMFPTQKIRRWCERGAFPGAFRVGTRWAIPLRAVLLREGSPTDHPAAEPKGSDGQDDLPPQASHGGTLSHDPMSHAYYHQYRTTAESYLPRNVTSGTDEEHNDIAKAQAWATLALAEAIREGFASLNR